MSEVTRTQEVNGSSAMKAYRRRAVAPPVDVFENADELLLVADVPGVPGDGFDLRFENDTLTLEARRPAADGEAQGPGTAARAREAADFAASFRVPVGVDAAGIAAEAKNGTLVVHLPKAANARARKIAVR